MEGNPSPWERGGWGSIHLLWLGVFRGGWESFVGCVWWDPLLIGVVANGAGHDRRFAGDGIYQFGGHVGPDSFGWPLLRMTLAQAAPILRYLLLVLILIFRPKGLLGKREG